MTLLAGVMGWPISHSLSPRLHSYWLAQHQIDGQYVPMAVAPGTLPQALTGLKALGFKGCNVTVPHKENVVPLLDELTPAAARIKAVNTIIIDQGKLIGDNTDTIGFSASLQDEAPGWAREAPVVILGAGGAARAVVDSLHQLGIKDIRVINRTPDHVDALAADLKVPLQKFTWGEAPLALQGAGLLINTTSLGMAGQPPLHLSLDNLPLSAVVFDIIYRPRHTLLLQTAAQRGHQVINGLSMLMHQAVPGFAAWFGHTPQVTPELRAHLEEKLA